ncbi:hypothetical protein [Streptomyces cyaneofuscatus]|uniref:hypothetical protein n=1 Tax=Streptomyces cyaneofuscatus TaxID=66883 RepID=UPI0034286529
MTPTATSVDASCSRLRAGIERPAEMSRSVDLPGLVDAEGGLVDVPTTAGPATWPTRCTSHHHTN